MPNKIRGLPESEEFEFNHWRVEFQFALMLKMRYGLEKRLIMTEQRFREMASLYLESEQMDHAIEKIMNSAYLTIPEGFYREAEKYNRINPS
jgi:hypothetical protein